MDEFVCKLGTASGQVIQRTYTAASENDLRREFESQDYLVFSIKRKAAAAKLLDFSAFKKKSIAPKEFLIFNQEFASLISAGLPIVNSLNVLLERRKNIAFKNALLDIRDQVKSGASLSDAFSSHGDLFPKLYGPSLASGEKSGEIAGVLRRYVAYSKTVLAMRKKVVSAMIYPLILAGMAGVLVVVLVTYVLPKFQELFVEQNMDLPLLTRVLLGFSHLITQNWILVIISVVALSSAAVSYKRSEAGAMAWDRYKLRIPFFGRIFTKYAVTRFTRTLATLVQGGIPLVTSLEISARAIGNRIFEREMMAVAKKVREGQPLWESLEKTGLVTDMAVEMIKVGESTGALEEMLTNVSTFYDDEIDTDLTTIVTLMEPAMLVFMAVVVATMLLAIYLPLLRSYSVGSF